MQLTLSKDDLQALAEQIAPLITTTQSEPDWVKLEDVRADLFAGKAKSWIRLYIFDRFPEIQIENRQPGAWVVGAHGTGKITKIYLPYARPWMHEHHDEIDWTAKEVR
ncbi:hypothetical protein [uncultured Limosilactobacillus sp.]|uniref:hypothetical protein n=1 Tax=uncultured Limosilactobacillus sp. TaxID=2837629 RepID=UPI0025935E3F|nr:hypothetical protein [uncultured Limosilactobacillus sp.]